MATRRHEHTHARWCAVQTLYAAEVCGMRPMAFLDRGDQQACLYTGDVLPELSAQVHEVQHAWEKRYEQWQAQHDSDALDTPAPELDDIDMSSYAHVDPLPSYALRLVQGVDDHLEQIDMHLQGTSSHWSVERMPITDRSILRIALFEMLYVPETPVSVAINEAVDLAKYFGGQDESSQFVNGVLGNVARSIEDTHTDDKGACSE